MTRPVRVLLVLGSAVVAVVGLSAGSAAAAAPGDGGPPTVTHLSDSTTEIPAGAACTFPVLATSTGGTVLTFPADDPLEDPVRHITRNPVMTFTNLDDPTRTYTVPSGTRAERWTYAGNGTYRVTMTGQHVMQSLPDDDPAGPALTLFEGHRTFIFEADETWTLVRAAGRSVDICAELDG